MDTDLIQQFHDASIYTERELLEKLTQWALRKTGMREIEIPEWHFVHDRHGTEILRVRWWNNEARIYGYS